MLGQNKNKKRYFPVLIGLLAIAQLLVSTPQVTIAAENRLSGSDGYRTAVKISQEGWKKSDTVILVRGDDFADALCAGPLAKKYNAPILFTDKYRIDTFILDEIERLKAEKVIIIGGYGAISRDIDDALDDEGIDEIERIYGDDRYGTSVKIAQRLGNKEIALATGGEYADALSISAVAALKGFAILLTDPDELPEIVEQHLKNYKVEKTYLIGGKGAISQHIENQVPSPQRFAGKNRYDTNRIVLEYFDEDLDFNRIYTAPGEGKENYTYALAGVPLAAQSSSPILLNSTILPEEIKGPIYSKMTAASEIIALGGTSVVPSRVLTQYSQGLDQVLKSVFDQEGIYGLSTGMTTIAGNLVIDKENITVQNMIIEGDLVLEEGIGDGTVELKNVLVKGRTTIRGGWDNRLTGNTFLSATVVVDMKNEEELELELLEKSQIGLLKAYSDVRLDDSEGTSQGFMNVEIIGAENVSLEGKYSTVNFTSTGVDLRLRTAEVTTLNARSGGDVWGTGTISTANISSDGVDLDVIPATTKVANGYKATVGGERVYEGTYTSSEIATLQLDPISNLKVDSVDDGEVSFTFSRAKDATSVILQKSEDGGDTWSTATTDPLDEDSTSATATGLDNDQSYRFKLVVTGGNRAGDSNKVTATPSAD